jgi:hypothetical protein
MIKTMRINHKMPTMNRITPTDLLASQILNGMIPSAFPHGKGLGLGTRFGLLRTP